MKTKHILRMYEPRIVAMLGNWRAALIDMGWHVSEADERHDECYAWSMLIQPDGDSDEMQDDRDIDITFTIAESTAYDGTRAGVNFIMDIVAYGGAIVGGMSPYNYTDRVWVKTSDTAELEDRFKMFEQVDPDQIISLIEQHLSRRARADVNVAVFIAGPSPNDKGIT